MYVGCHFYFHLIRTAYFQYSLQFTHEETLKTCEKVKQRTNKKISTLFPLPSFILKKLSFIYYTYRRNKSEKFPIFLSCFTKNGRQQAVRCARCH